MNEHLNPIFEMVLPAIEEAGISYWVYGAVAIAGIKGEFVRPTRDVDIFVFEEDYQRTLEIVEYFEGQLDWRPIDAPLLRGRRPKREWIPIGSKKDIFSVIPVYKTDDEVLFVFDKDFIPTSPLTRELRVIGPHTFTTPSLGFMRELFLQKLNSGRLRDDRKEKCRKDAPVLFADHESEALLSRLIPKT